MVKPFGGDGFEGLLVEIRLDPLVLEGAFVTVIESARGKGASIDIGVVKAAKAHATSKTRAFIEFTPSPKYQRCKPGSVTLSLSGNPLKCPGARSVTDRTSFAVLRYSGYETLNTEEMAMKRVLLAYDGSPGAEEALKDLTRAGLGDKVEARVLTLADVWLPPDLGKYEPIFPDSVPQSQLASRTRAVEELRRAVEVSKTGAAQLTRLFPQWTVSHSGRADSPAWGIMAEARRWKADLVVMGSHGRKLLERFFLGSVCQKVAVEVTCSVRIFRPQREPRPSRGGNALRIMIAVDGSSESSIAVREAARRPWGAAEFALVTVADPRLLSMPGFFVLPQQWQKATDQKEEWVRRMNEDAAEELRKSGFPVETFIIEGDPKNALLHHSQQWGADCIFLGSRGMDHGDRLYLGTVASALASRADCSVEIVRDATAGKEFPRIEPSAKAEA